MASSSLDIYLLHNTSRYRELSTHHGMKRGVVEEEQSYKSREKYFPLCPISCCLGHRKPSTSQELAITTNNYGISSKSGFIHRAMTQAFPFTNPCHSLLPITILLACPSSIHPQSCHSCFTWMYLDVPVVLFVFPAFGDTGPLGFPPRRVVYSPGSTLGYCFWFPYGE